MFALKLYKLATKIKKEVTLKGGNMPDDPDPRDYLETDARIIAENDSYAVIAIRVDKAAIARNLALFAALADLLPPCMAPRHVTSD